MTARSLLILALASPLLAGDVLVVDKFNGPYTDLQTAIDAAGDGDTLLVRTGNYDPATIFFKGLNLVADTGHNVTIQGGLTLDTTLGHHEILVAGILMVGVRESNPTYVHRPALAMDTVRGPVRIEDCVMINGDADGWCDSDPPGDCAGGDAVWIADGLDVAFSRCTIEGGDGELWYIGDDHNRGGHAVQISGGSVAFYSCDLRGGDGWSSEHTSHFLDQGGHGGDGVNARGSAALGVEVHLSGTLAAGGIGGDGELCICTGGDGGDGVHAIGVNAMVWQLDNTLSGEPGGCGGGNPLDGKPLHLELGASAHTFAGLSRGFTASGPLRENTQAPMTFTGEPGDQVTLLVSPTGGFVVRPFLNGAQLLAVPGLTERRFLGVLPGSGSMTVDFPVGELPAGVEALTVHTQSLHRNVNGRNYLGPGWTVVLLDGQF